MLGKVLPLLALFASALLSALAHAAPEPDRRPEAARRTVAYFSFDDKDNPQEVPTYWFREQDDASIGRKRPGFPGWNKAELDLNVHARGSGSVRLPTRGGSTSLTLERGVIPVFEGADYQISFMVRTDHLASAKALLEARFLDSTGKPVPGASIRSRPASTGGRWVEMAIDLLGGAQNVAFLQIELLLLQPDQLKSHVSAPADLSGAAWFDEIRVVQLPRIELSSRAPANIVIAPDTPHLEAMVRDLTGEELDLQLDVLDTSLKPVFSEHRTILPGRSYSDFTPRLPRYGWYRSRVSVLRNSEVVGTADVDFVWVNALPSVRSPDAARFGLSSDDAHPTALHAMPALVSGLAVSQVTLPAWSTGVEKTALPASIQSLVPVVKSLSDAGNRVTLSLPELPEEAARSAKSDPESVWALFELDPGAWRPWLDPYLDRFGQRVTTWQIGNLARPHQGSIATLPARASALREAFSTLVPGPTLSISFPSDYAPPRFTPGVRAVVRVPLDIPPEALSAVTSAGQSYVLPHSADDELTVQQRIDDLARRTVELWAAIAADPLAQLSIERPWNISANRRPEVSPTPEFAVFRTLISHLSGSRALRRLPAGPGVRAYLFAPLSGGSEGTVIAWSESADPEHSALVGALGQSRITLVDLFGNTANAPLDLTVPADQRNTLTPCYRIPLSSTPVIVEHVDLQLLEFIAAAKVEPPVIQATMRAAEHAIRIRNTWSSGLTAKLTIVRPGAGRAIDGGVDRSWTISPRVASTTLAAGEEASLPFIIAFPPGEEAGPKAMTIDFELSAERQYGRVRVDTELQLALDGIDLQVQAIRSPTSDGPDVIIEAAVTNQTGQTLNADITAFLPGAPRDRRSIPALESGSLATRRFVLKGSGKELQGRRIVLSFTEERQGVRLNKSVVIP